MSDCEAGQSPWAALHGLRIGCVQYLNAEPLIHCYDREVVFDHPSALARELTAGRLDAALVPVFEVLRDPVYDLVDGVAVASDGPVHSVVLAYRGELRDVRSVSLDPASLTSAHLLQVLLAEFHGLHPAYGAGGEARLLIGNQAIEFRAATHDPELHWLDLGEEWRARTELPFVFAAWALRPGLDHPRQIGDAFRELKNRGQQQLATIVGNPANGTTPGALSDPAFRNRYLSEHIRYELGLREKEGLARYRSLLAKWLLVASEKPPLRFV